MQRMACAFPGVNAIRKNSYFGRSSSLAEALTGDPNENRKQLTYIELPDETKECNRCTSCIFNINNLVKNEHGVQVVLRTGRSRRSDGVCT